MTWEAIFYKKHNNSLLECTNIFLSNLSSNTAEKNLLMCHLTWNLELQRACISVFRNVLIRFGIENKKRKKCKTKKIPPENSLGNMHLLWKVPFLLQFRISSLAMASILRLKSWCLELNGKLINLLFRNKTETKCDKSNLAYARMHFSKFKCL